MTGARSALGRIALLTVTISSAGGISAGAASATVFCVNAVASQHCAGTSEPDLQTALDAASTAPNDTHRNTVMVGNPGPPSATGYTYAPTKPAANPVDIIGAGQGTTTLTATGGSNKSGKVLWVQGDGSTVSNLHIVIPATVSRTALYLSGGSASRILVTAPTQHTLPLVGVTLDHGSSPSGPASSLTQSAIKLPTGSTGGQTGVSTAIGATLRDVTVAEGRLDFFTPSPGYPSVSTVRRVRIGVTPEPGGTTTGLSVTGTTVNADNVTLRLSGGSGSAIGANVVSNGSDEGVLNLNHASVYGNANASPAPPTSIGVQSAITFGTTAVTVRNSIIRNFLVGTSRSTNGAGTDATVRYDYSDYDPSHQTDVNTSGGTGGITVGTGNLNGVDPRWLNPGAGDFRLRATSPVINKGAPAALNSAIESTVDILGHPRISGPRRDMGAVEFQLPPRFKLLTGKFDPHNGKVRLPVHCNQPAGDRCRFKLTLKAKLKRKVNGKRKHKTISLSLQGSAAGGKSVTLTARLPNKAFAFVAGRSKLTAAAGGTVTDNESAVAHVSGHVTLKSGNIGH